MLLTSILLSALFAGIVATLVTIAIEKFGGRTGGVLATIPTTIVPAALGMYTLSGETEFAQSMSIVPVGMMVNAMFLLVWIHAPQRFGLSNWNNDSLIGCMDVYRKHWTHFLKRIAILRN